MVDGLVDLAKFLFGFLPWLVFLFLPAHDWESLRRSVAFCLILSVLFSWRQLRAGFILQWASVAFFLGCTIAFYGLEWVWLADHMSLIANGFLDGIIWLTVLAGKPFTLQYARAELPPEKWYDRDLVQSCGVIAVFWGVLLLVPTAFSVFRLLHPAALADGFYFALSLVCIVSGGAATTVYKAVKRNKRMKRLDAAAGV